MNYEKFADELLELFKSHSRRKADTPSDYFSDSLGGEYAVLSELADKGVATSGSLSRTLCRSTARIANTLKSLESKGFVKRRHDVSDRRKVMVEITEKGMALVKKKTEELQVMTAKLFETMGERDAAEFLRLQKKALAVLGARYKTEEV